jgi:hypothetical protein
MKLKTSDNQMTIASQDHDLANVDDKWRGG